jgi:hypothetical protein
MEATQKRVVSRQSCSTLWLSLLSVLLMFTFSAWGFAETQDSPCLAESPVLAVLDWFDPIFFSYNVLLFVFAVLIVPSIMLGYINNGMKEEKRRRVKNTIPEAQWRENGTVIEKILARQFRRRNYWGSVLSLTVTITFGLSIILLLKPLQNQTQGCGVDYSKGANILLLGPYVMLFKVNDGEFYRHVIVSLTAFQFGFLGAYVYMISDLMRGYFTLDLTPQTFVANTIRLLTASLFALVLSFACAHVSPALDSFTPVISFFFGYFPDTALIYLSNLVTVKLPLKTEEYQATPLSRLPGISYAHLSRLRRDGYDNVENLAMAIPLELILHTGFSYLQVRQWVSQAWLFSHFGEDYAAFVKNTGITSADELVDYLEQPTAAGLAEAEALLIAANKEQGPEKQQIVGKLAQLWKQQIEKWRLRDDG